MVADEDVNVVMNNGIVHYEIVETPREVME